jgi:hypothetical protein
MNSTPQEIVPAQITDIKEIYYFSASVDRVELFTSAKITVKLMNDKKITVDIKMLDLTGQDNANWGNDDQYIINYVMNKLNFTPK